MPLFKIISIVLVVLTAYSIGMWFVIKEDEQCDTRVTFTDGESHECRDVYSFRYTGMSRIKLCNGTTIDVPTVRIKTVIR